jgi:undecaprenyl-diphosphatase
VKRRQRAGADVPGLAPGAEGGAVARFDAAVDSYFETHLRGKRALDVLMYGASAAADHSMIWLALAGVEGWRAGQGGRTLRRAGVALGAESVLVNALIKLAFQRRRPESPGPHPLPLRTPRTSSFPSGHASAAFFAAALLRDGAPAPLVYAAAVTVAASRVYVGMHHASDVIAGAALGAALGEVARRVYPVLPRQEQSTPDRRL